MNAVAEWMLFVIGTITYWTLFAICIIVALQVRPRRTCLLALAAVVIVFGAKPAYDVWDKHHAQYQLKRASVMLRSLCADAGERIHRKVENVHGIVLLRVRALPYAMNRQYALNDPYGWNCIGVHECVTRYLYGMHEVGPGGIGGGLKDYFAAYQYVDYVDPTTSVRYRYTKASPTALLVRTQTDDASTRYGVEWRDISTHEQRSYWIAGGSLRVIDLQTNEVIAERIGYMLDPRQGRTDANEDPWGRARLYGPSCPSPREHNLTFVLKVLKP